MNRIKDVLEEKGINQIWLAEKLGKSYNMVNSYVENRRQPSLEDLYKISEPLYIDVKELLISQKKHHLKILEKTKMKENFMKTLQVQIEAKKLNFFFLVQKIIGKNCLNRKQ